MKLRKSAAVWLCAAIAAGTAGLEAPREAAAAVQATYWTSPDGSGNACTQAEPCALTTARDQVRGLASMTGDVVVNLRGGTYRMTEAFTLTNADSGRDGNRVIYQAAPGEKPIFDGSQAISSDSWEQHDAAAGIWRAPVGDLEFRQLYVGGELAVRARTPNLTNPATGEGYFTMTQKATYPYSVSTADNIYSSRWHETEMVVVASWKQIRARIDTYTPAGPSAVVTFQSAERGLTSRLNLGKTGKYFMENAYEYLDAGGEWYLDRSSSPHMLYYKPRQGETMAQLEVSVPVAQTLLSVAGADSSNKAHDIVVQGIEFRYTNWTDPDQYGYITQQSGNVLETNFAGNPGGVFLPGMGSVIPGAVMIRDAGSIVFERNRISYTGAHGLVTLAQTDHLTIEGNVIERTAAGGIWLEQLRVNGGDQHSRVANNLVLDFGTVYAEAAGIAAGKPAYATITHNDVHRGGYTGITIGFTWLDVEQGSTNNDISYNRISDVSRVHGDGGGIYSLGRMDDTSFHHNYIAALRTPVDIGGGSPAGRGHAGIYLDNGSKLKTVEKNVINGCGTAMFTNDFGQSGTSSGAYENTIRDNFYNCDAEVNQTLNTVSGNVQTTGQQWSVEARDIMGRAGIEPAYRDIMGGNLARFSAAFVDYPVEADGLDAYSATDDLSMTAAAERPWTFYPWRLTVDLGGPIVYDTVVLRYGSQQRPVAYTIDVSIDGKNWASATTQSQAAVSPLQDSKLEARLPLGGPVAARYVRLSVTETSGGFNSIPGVMLHDFEVRQEGDESASTPVNLALTATATASTYFDLPYTPDKAIDGNLGTLWASKGIAVDTGAWIALDLGAAKRMSRVEIVARQDMDQSSARQNFEVQASNQPDFSNYIVLGRQGIEPFPHLGTWAVDVVDPNRYRYVRLIKTLTGGQTISEFRVWGYENAASPTSVDLTGYTEALVGESAAVNVAISGYTGEALAQDLTVQFDADRLEFLQAVSLDDEYLVVDHELTQPGVVRILSVFTGSLQTNPNGEWLQLRFRAKADAPAGPAVVSVAQATLADDSHNEVAIGQDSHSITVAAADKAALSALIAQAQSAHAGAVEGKLIGQYPVGAKAALLAAIAAATLVADDVSATQSQVNQAYANLNLALITFGNSVIVHVPGDFNSDDRVSVSDLSRMVKAYGKTSADSDWQQIRSADLNNDGKVDIEDLVLMARLIFDW